MIRSAEKNKMLRKAVEYRKATQSGVRMRNKMILLLTSVLTGTLMLIQISGA